MQKSLIRKITQLRAVWLKHILLISMMAFCLLGHGQSVSVNAKLDSTIIFIGGQIDLKLEVSQPEDIAVQFPLLTDTITKNIEILSVSKIDTTKLESNRLLLEQNYRITCFDSGLHYIPPIQFELAESKLEKMPATEALALMVVNPFEKVNADEGFFDIKKPVNTPFNLAELMPYIWLFLGLTVLAIGITILILWLVKKKPPINLTKKEKPKEPAHITALRSLDRIKSEKLWQRHLLKQYYSDVTATLRQYIEERYDIATFERTTDEILTLMNGADMPDHKPKDQLKQILQLADLVKFAKFEPLPDENDLTMINAYFFVNQTKHEELKSLEENKEALTKKEESDNKLLEESSNS
ncbi:hypothetical protein DMA11_11570 [Marinilabiliaceae bacterium JC017]|nr:hypothetical protein DMA11_11570 [Marinilabiliaceae bacterium JC017]